MSRLRWLLSISFVAMISSSAWAQAQAPEPVIGHIPAGSMGFVVAPSLEGLTGKIDKFIDDIGFGQMLSQPDPSDSSKTIRISVLDMLRGAGQFGQGFNPKGGVAAVMLDLKKFNIDIMELMNPGAATNGDNAGEAKAPPKLPVVIFIPGKDVKGVLGAYNPQPAGKYMTVMLPPGPMYAGQIGSYVMLSPNDKALDAVAAATKKAASELPAEQIKAINTAQIAVCMNGKVAGPVLMEIMQMAEAEMSANPGPGMDASMMPLMKTYFRMYREMLSQLDTITMAGRFVNGGLVFEELISFQPDSPYGKALRAQKLINKVDFAALPDLPYVLAATATGSTSQQVTEMGTDIINSLLNSDPLSELPSELKASITKSYQDMLEQVTGMQFVGGGSPEGSGVFGLSMVIKCKDSAKMKDILAEDAKIAQALIKHFGKDDEDAKAITVKYVKGEENVGSISADAIVIDTPKLTTMSDNDREEMKKVLGEDKLLFRVAATDKNTVVVTFGGAKPFFAEAVKVAAANTGRIGTDPNALAAVKHLPAERNSVVLFNASNLFKAIVTGMKAVAPDSPPPPFQITTTTPIVIGAGKTGKSAHVVMFVPTDLIKEVAGIFGMMMAPQGGGAPPMGGSDF